MTDLSRTTRSTFTFTSSDRTSTIGAYAWWPDGIDPTGTEQVSPRGAVQLVHGMAEHITRYDAFARALADEGFVVCGHDQIGHGESSDPGRYGCIPSHGGEDLLLNDIGTVRELVSDRLALGTPYFLFGHSFGSFLARAYISRCAPGLAGAIICGTGFVDPAASAVGNAVARLCCRLRGDDAKLRLLHAMADGAYANAIPAAKTSFDWLSHNEENVRTYIMDPACGFMFSAGGYATLTALTAETCSKPCVERTPHDLPLLFVAGAEDPVGDEGEGVRKAYQMYQDAGFMDVTLQLYAGMRHEILNEDGRKAVYHDIIDWLEERS